MRSPTYSARQSLRRVAFMLALLLGSFAALAGTSGASAQTLIPLVDAGGSGGGGGAASAPAPFVLTANQRSIAMTEDKDPANAGIAFIHRPGTTVTALATTGFEDIRINFSIEFDGMA